MACNATTNISGGNKLCLEEVGRRNYYTTTNIFENQKPDNLDFKPTTKISGGDKLCLEERDTQGRYYHMNIYAAQLLKQTG